MLNLLILILCVGVLALAVLMLVLIHRHCQKSNWWDGPPLPAWPPKLALTLMMLALVLFLVNLLTGCASPCHPTLQPGLMNAVPGPAGMVEQLGIVCDWSF
jgi:NADH:ubiquinone oxidoreductase subunit 6 (subunit J)